MIQDADNFLGEDNVSGETFPEKTRLLAAQLYSRDLTFKASKGALHRVVSFHVRVILAIKGMSIGEGNF